jgi:predicted ATPase
MATRQPGSKSPHPGAGLFAGVPSLAGAGNDQNPNESRRSARVYFVGAHATGKTTLARYVRDRYGLKLISEVARSILAEMEVGLDRLRSNIDTVNRYQLAVFRRQIQAERDAGDSFVSDRAFCNLAYTANHATVMHEIFRDPALEEYMRWVSAGLVFFVRPHPDLIQTDGVRTALRWEDVVLIDGMVKLLLEMYAIPYITISVLSMQERVRMVDEVIRLRYPEIALKRWNQRQREVAGNVPRMPRIHGESGDGDEVPPSPSPKGPASSRSAGSGVETKSGTSDAQRPTRDSQPTARDSRAPARDKQPAARAAPRRELDELAAATLRDSRQDLAPDS